MRNVAIIVLYVFVLQGCLLERLEESKEQLCSKQIKLFISNSISLIFDRPTLYPNDIKKLLGKEPSSIENGYNKKIFAYTITRKNDTSGYFDIPVNFEFIEKPDGRYYLSEAIGHKNINGIVPAPLATALFCQICNAKREIDRVKLDFSDVDLKELPNMEGIQRLLGEPHFAEANRCIYIYELNGSDAAKIEIFYDSGIETLKTIVLTFFRYELEVDFIQKTAVGNVKDLFASLNLAFVISISH